MSTVPLVTSGMRFCEVTGRYFTSSFLPTCFSRLAMMRWHSSTWYPVYLPSPRVYDSAPDESRTPIVMTPEFLTLAMVSFACANTPPQAAATATANKTFFMQLSWFRDSRGDETENEILDR